MTKYWFKNRLLLGIITGIILAVSYVFIFVYLPNNKVVSIKKDNIIYLNSEIDYQIPNPTKEQVDEIKSLNYVNDVFGYYFTKVSASCDKSEKTNLMLVDNLESMNLTMYNEKNLIDSIENTSKYAFVDEIALKRIGGKIGSTVKINIANTNFDFIICKIYSENKLFKEGSIIVPFSGSIKSLYEAQTSSDAYSAAFIDAEDLNACDNYLKNYIPKGRLKTREEFETDEAYNAYNNAILSGSYYNEITNFADYRKVATKDFDNAMNNLKIMKILGIVAIGVVYIAISELLRFRKSENLFFAKTLKQKNKIKWYRILSMLSEYLFTILFIFGLSLILSVTSITWISISCISSFIISLIINLLQDRKYVRKTVA